MCRSGLPTVTQDGTHLPFTGVGVTSGIQVFTVTAAELASGLAPSFVDVDDATALDITGTTRFMGSVLAPPTNAEITPSTVGRLYVGGDLEVGGDGQEEHSHAWIGVPPTAGDLVVRVDGDMVTGSTVDEGETVAVSEVTPPAVEGSEWGRRPPIPGR